MTEIKYTEKGDKIRITLHGHALFNPGNDIVCSAVSVITFQLLRYLDALDTERSISDFCYEVTDGHVIVTFTVNEGEMDAWQIAWKVLSGGYEMLAEKYPGNVRFGADVK